MSIPPKNSRNIWGDLGSALYITRLELYIRNGFYRHQHMNCEELLTSPHTYSLAAYF